MDIIKRVAAINDICGIGRCSLTAAIPIFSALGIQCSPFPTAVLSCQTEFSEFSFLDITDEMVNYNRIWNNHGFKFECIYTGFLGSAKQIDIVLEFIKEHEGALIIVDPVMGDNGIIYDTYTDEMCNKMKNLVAIADIITPNLTEACILTNKKYSTDIISVKDLLEIAKKLVEIGAKKVIITGIRKGDEVINFAYDSDTKEYFSVASRYNHKSYSGTGDIFTSIVSGMILNNYSLKFSVEKATKFIEKVIEFTSKYNTDSKEGIMFEKFLRDLILINS